MLLISTRLSMTCWFFSFNLFLLALLILSKETTYLLEWQLLNPSTTPIKFIVIMDLKGLLFASAVLFISANVFYFSSFYMSQEQFLPRFSLIVALFVLSMTLLIFIPHMMCLLLGWDGLGLVSFALVIYYQNPKSLSAGMITALTNRIGDVMLLVAISWSITQGHWTITLMFDNFYSPMISVFILLAAMTKSAQMPFSSWLPAAMAAPTPVSALVHSSTLVTAGVFLLIRFFPFISKSPSFSPLLLILSSLTMLMAGASAITETDLKKIIALSTLSQLGVMMMSLSLSLSNLAFFHLITHAMFKSLLFLAAGTIIHLSLHSQDLRTVGNTSLQLPLSISSMIIANMALSGAPFLAGFYSKDLILETSLSSPFNILIITTALLATAMTTTYSMRLMILSSWAPSTSAPMHSMKDSYSSSTSPMLFLSLAAITTGSLLNWTLLPLNLEPFLSTPMKLTPLLLITFSALISWKFSSPTTSSSSIWLTWPTTHLFNTSMWFLTPLSTQPLIKSPMQLAKSSSNSLDFGWWEQLIPQSSYSSLISNTKLMMKIPTPSPTLMITFSTILILPLIILFTNFPT